MTLQATYLEQPTPGDETVGVLIMDVNPFGANGEKDRQLLISKDAEPILILQLYVRADEDVYRQPARTFVPGLIKTEESKVC